MFFNTLLGTGVPYEYVDFLALILTCRPDKVMAIQLEWRPRHHRRDLPVPQRPEQGLRSGRSFRAGSATI